MNYFIDTKVIPLPRSKEERREKNRHMKMQWTVQNSPDIE
jgi:hypothetical protein